MAETHRDNAPRPPWRLAPGATLHERVRTQVSPVRVVAQTLVLTALVVAPIFDTPWLYLAGAFVFFLMVYGVTMAQHYATNNFAQVPVLSPDDAVDLTAAAPRVLIISPARNEEHEVGRAARSLAAQDYPNYDVVLINDHSTDCTGAIMDEVAAAFPAVRVLHDPPPRPGWIGKPNAIQHALDTIQPDHDWYLFVDADVVLAPDALRAAVARAEAQGADFLTCQPVLETGSVIEKLILPSQWRNIISATPYTDLNHPETHPVGIGAFILVRRSIYEKSGGHSRHPLLHSDDTLLAGVVKEAGGVVDLARAPALMSIRLYCGAGQTFRTNVAKARTYTGDALLPSVAMVTGSIAPGLLPLPFALWGLLHAFAGAAINPFALVYAALGGAAYVQRARAFRGTELVSDVSARWGWLHPLASLVHLAIYATATWKTVSGAPRYWRGRQEKGAEGLL